MLLASPPWWLPIPQWSPPPMSDLPNPLVSTLLRLAQGGLSGLAGGFAALNPQAAAFQQQQAAAAQQKFQWEQELAMQQSQAEQAQKNWAAQRNDATALQALQWGLTRDTS